MRPFKSILLFAILIMACFHSFGQCVDSTNIYSFTYNGHAYEVVKENKSWTAASACAVSRNGYLAEINDEAEQNAIFEELTNNAGINAASTQNIFGTASIWLGGSDAGTEGDWIWDGNNDSTGPQFWDGGPSGSAVDGLYSNWGISPAEPDNSGGQQDHLTIIIKTTAINYGLWNDLNATGNSLYYLIESDHVVATQDLELKNKLSIYPNPFNNLITINNNNAIAIDRIHILNLVGQRIKTIHPNELRNKGIDVSSLENGMYILNVHFENGQMISQKVVK